MKAFQAYAKGCRTTSAASPRAAAEAFFAAFPDKRKCNVIEGKTDGHFFSVTYGLRSNGEWPQSYKDVTKKTAVNLPHEAAA